MITCFTSGIGVHTTDLPQGNQQANVKQCNARFGCRFCMIKSDSWLDVDFDIILNARRDHETARLLDVIHYQPTDNEKIALARTHGLSMRYEQPFRTLLFDRHRQIPIDPAHCICQGLDAVLINATIALLSPAGKLCFAAELDGFQLPQGWPKFQDPVNHLRSFFFSDLARLIMIGPFLLCALDEDNFSKRTLRSMRMRMGLRSNTRVISEVLECWIQLASVSGKIFASEMDDYDELGCSLRCLSKQLLWVRLQCNTLLIIHTLN